jgi:hypothetical protein
MLLISVVIIGAIPTGFVLLDDSVFTFGDTRPQLHVLEPQTNHTGDGSMIAFGELTPEQQGVFEQALENDSEYRTARIPSGVNDEVWVENRYVRYQNESYRVGVMIE